MNKYYNKTERIFLKTQFGQTDLTHEQAVDQFNNYFPERDKPMVRTTWSSLKKERTNFPGTDEEWIDYHDVYITSQSKKYTSVEKAWIIEKADLHNTKSFAVAFRKKFKYIRSPEGLRRQVPILTGKKSERNGLLKPISVDKIHPTLRLKEGQDLSRGSHETYVVICKKEGHETEKWSFDIERSGCSKCRDLLTNHALRHANPLEPGIFYYGTLLDSLLDDLKLGNTLERIGVEVRAKNYGNFEWKEVHKPIGEVEDFEELMIARYDGTTFDNYCSNNPMLKKNGSTECFYLIVLPDLEMFIDIWTSKGLAAVKTKLDMALKI